MKTNHGHNRIGFISTRLAGTDGVSLETQKWDDILTRLGFQCFYFAGECDRPADRSHVVPEAHFKYPDIQAVNDDLFDDYVRSPETSVMVQKIRDYLKQKIYSFIRQFDINLLIVENALAIPMNVPLGLALTEVIAETNMPTIAHHHDFTWERQRFSVNAAQDYLQAAFPPLLPSISHVVINSFGARQLARRTGISGTLIPNVMNFKDEPPEETKLSQELRAALNIPPNQEILLQPTRIVPRKRIELAIELCHRLDRNCILLITHTSGDEGTAYEKYLRQYADILGVEVIFGCDIINHRRGNLPNGRRVFSLADAYHIANLVTYPSTIEGFGNAFLESIYYRCPIVISMYEIFKTDIHPKGFRVIGFENFISDETVRLTRHILEHPEYGAEMASHNYKIGQRYYSFQTLEKQLAILMNQCF